MKADGGFWETFPHFSYDKVIWNVQVCYKNIEITLWIEKVKYKDNEWYDYKKKKLVALIERKKSHFFLY